VPVAIEAKLKDGRHWTESGNKITMSPTLGLRCKNADQPKGKKCKDFKVRFLCQLEPGPVAEWTEWLNRDKPTFKRDHEAFEDHKIEERVPEDCKPIATEVRLANGNNAAESGNKVHMEAHRGFWCINRENGGKCRDFEVRFLCLSDPDLIS